MYALDRLPQPSPDFDRVQKRAECELGTSIHYRQIDVRDVPQLNQIVEEIGSTHKRLDGLIAAAGIQQETVALEYTAEDANRMFEVNITGVFMTAQAVAKQMIHFGNGGSICLIASMSAHIANRVRLLVGSDRVLERRAQTESTDDWTTLGTVLCSLQCLQGRGTAARTQSCRRMGRAQHPGQHHLARLHRH